METPGLWIPDRRYAASGMTAEISEWLVFAGRSADAPQPVARRAQIRARAATHEVAVGEAEARDRAAEARLAGALEVEAGLERQAADRGAVAVAVGPQRPGGQHHVAARPVAANLDIARHR